MFHSQSYALVVNITRMETNKSQYETLATIFPGNWATDKTISQLLYYLISICQSNLILIYTFKILSSIFLILVFNFFLHMAYSTNSQSLSIKKCSPIIGSIYKKVKFRIPVQQYHSLCPSADNL